MPHRFALPLVLLAACGENQTTPRAPYEPLPGMPLSCLPNLDGVIEGDELTPALGVTASYIATPALPPTATSGRPVDVIGAVDGDGRRVWDWRATEPNDQVGQLTARPLAEQWYVTHFPHGELAVPVDLGGRIHAIYSHDDTALWLHGTASSEENPPDGQTLLVYDSPIPFLSFPLTVGKSWSQTAEVRSGVLLGLSPWSQDETYSVTVDAAGELRLPDFTFTQVLRVRTLVSVAPKTGAVQPTSQRQVSFVFECFGEVARATSLFAFPPAPPPPADFTEAHEIRKLGWF